MVDPWARFLESSQQLNNTLQQMPANDMRMRLMGRQMQQFQDEDAQRDIYRNSDPNNPDGTVAALQKGGYGKEAMTYQQALESARASKFRGAAEMYKLSQAAAEHIASQPDDLLLPAFEASAMHLSKLTGADPTQQVQWARQTAQQPGGLELIRQQAIQQAGQMKLALVDLGDKQQVVNYGPTGIQQVGDPLPKGKPPLNEVDQARADYYRAQSGKGANTHEATKPTFGYEYAPDGTIRYVKGGPHDPEAPQNKKENKEGGGKVMPAGQIVDLADMKKVRDELQSALEFINEKKAKNQDVQTGPVAGRYQAGKAIVGIADDDFLTLRQKFAAAENIMLKLRSGAAVTDQEFARFQREYPNVNDPPETRDAKLQGAIAYATGLLDEKVTLLEEGGYKIPGSVKSGKAQPAKPAPTGGGSGAQEGDKNAKGWVLHVDANGNKAYVGPNGEIEEVQ